MSIFEDKIEINPDLPRLKKVLNAKVNIGSKVQECMNSDGFQVLLAIFKQIENETKETRFETFEAYNSRMDALALIRELLGRFESYIADAETASTELVKIIESENSTPSVLSLDGEGTDSEEGQ